jgi:monoterpene epsilon-lactone hydrolase
MASKESEGLRNLYVELSGRMAANPQMDLENMRDLFERFHRAAAEPEGVAYAEAIAGGVPGLWCLPDGAPADHAVLYLHGGGYSTCSPQTHRKLAGHLASAAAVRTLVLDYRLAPEHVFPAQIDDSVAAYRSLLAQGISADHIAIAGDSSGGGQAASTVLKMRELGEELPGAMVAFSPLYDLEVKGASMETNAATDALIQREMPLGMVAMYLGESGSASDPVANPLYADLAGFPPSYLAAGGYETLLDDAVRFADRAQAAGADVTLEIVPEMQHVYVFMAGRAPEADQTIANVGGWLRAKLGLDARVAAGLA